MIVMLALLSTTLSGAPAQASSVQLKEATQLSDHGKELQDQGKFAESKTVLLQAVERLKQLSGAARDEELQRAQNNLATAYRRLGEPKKAVELLEALVKPKDPANAKDRVSLRVLLNNLAAAYRFAGQAPEARRALEMCVSLAPEPPDEDAAIALDNLAALLIGEGDLDAAEKYARRGNAAWSALRGKEDIDYAISLATLGSIAAGRAKADEARRLYGESLRLQEKLRGPWHPDLGGLLNLIGLFEFEAGHPDAARKALLRSLEISRRASLREDHPQVEEAKLGLAVLSAKYPAPPAK
jgi:tetratricopeptide (TPR) repeat protein